MGTHTEPALPPGTQSPGPSTCLHQRRQCLGLTNSEVRSEGTEVTVSHPHRDVSCSAAPPAKGSVPQSVKPRGAPVPYFRRFPQFSHVGILFLVSPPNLLHGAYTFSLTPATSSGTHAHQDSHSPTMVVRVPAAGCLSGKRLLPPRPFFGFSAWRLLSASMAHHGDQVSLNL